MDHVAREIRLYRTPAGPVPFTDWFEGLRDATTQQRIDARLARVRLGNIGDCKAVGGGVSELRLNFGPGYRVYFGQDGQTIVVLLCGGDKSTQARDLKQAQKYWAGYKARENL